MSLEADLKMRDSLLIGHRRVIDGNRVNGAMGTAHIRQFMKEVGGTIDRLEMRDVAFTQPHRVDCEVSQRVNHAKHERILGMVIADRQRERLQSHTPVQQQGVVTVFALRPDPQRIVKLSRGAAGIADGILRADRIIYGTVNAGTGTGRKHQEQHDELFHIVSSIW